ncbi:MAG: proline--tRNA ligase [Chloroflexota bacterium]|nr:proline--tRNA ligase [Chloroflexota bacterium]
MRMAHLFGRTLREAPADAEIPSHQLMVRAAMIRPLGAGLYSLLPLGYRVIRKIEQIVREEMDRIGGQEMLMPVVHPSDIWERSGRWHQVGPELTRLKDRGGRDLVLAMTHEEVVTDLTSTEINSYRQLPQIIYHIQTKWRDEPRSRGGLIRVREFTMKDSYTLDTDAEALNTGYEKHAEAYDRIFTRLGLRFIKVGADVGMMGGSKSEEYMAFSPNGEDTLFICPTGDYAANREVAEFRRDEPKDEDRLEMELVETPQTDTIAKLAELLDISLSRTAKAVFYIGESGRFVFAVIRGDLDVNETKLRQVTGEGNLTPATADRIRAHGAEPGYGSPVGVKDAVIVVDESVKDSPNLVAGANKPGYHLKNVNLGRDYKADTIADIASAWEGAPCPKCGTPMMLERGIEVGNIFQLGTRYTEKMGATYLDQDGKARPVVMGSYGIGIGRNAAAVVEQCHDERGIIWPVSIAPYHVSLLSLGKDDEVIEATDRLYDAFQAAGIEVLYDDRTDRPGVKFTDAELIGNPIRLSVSSRTLQAGEVELRMRTASESEMVPMDEIVERVKGIITDLLAELDPDKGA